MKLIFSICFLVLSACSTVAPRASSSALKVPGLAALPISSAGFSGIGFEPHPNYLSMNLPFAPFSQLHDEVEQSIAHKLITRGEAHITVVTPPEFDVLKAHLAIGDLNRIAGELHLEQSKVDPICIGRATAVLKTGPQAEEVYFVVVKADELLQVRRAIEMLFQKRGGDATAFVASHFTPHVTVGFTQRDLFETDGAIKDVNSCWTGIVTK